MWKRIKLKLKLFFLRLRGEPLYGFQYKERYGSIDLVHFINLIGDHREKLEKILGKEVLINGKVLLKAMPRKYYNGWFYCPCRFERSQRTMCPCIYHINELAKHGRCKCGLFYIPKK